MFRRNRFLSLPMVVGAVDWCRFR
ncbi:hypothetical protein HID58_023157 [Brassica napus]|uniref:Uncharacterized protein n=1 Tax=Brassica napus TaxID=3708 RepID=A0ABQ8D1A7_BRANA|nr:hypothetical protein HID58_054754 [Brassica napus]KAH0923139.1 hypothetical protein HID58_023157 [Brassica napus]